MTFVPRGEVVVLTDHPLGAPPINRLEQWSSHLSTGSAWSETTVRLELKAYLRPLSFAPLSDAEPRAVHAHAGYTMTVFRRAVGTPIGSYVTQCRVAHAQRLE